MFALALSLTLRISSFPSSHPLLSCEQPFKATEVPPESGWFSSLTTEAYCHVRALLSWLPELQLNFSGLASIPNLVVRQCFCRDFDKNHLFQRYTLVNV